LRIATAQCVKIAALQQPDGSFLVINIDEFGATVPLLEAIYGCHYTARLRLIFVFRFGKEQSDGNVQERQIRREKR